MRRSSHRIAGLVSVIALFVFSSCQSFPDRFYAEGLNAAAEAEASSVDAPLRALRPRLEKAKLRADADYAAVSALNAWAAYYLKRNEPDKALPLLDEADAVSLSADFNRYRRYTTTLRALVAFQRGDATSALETVGKARSIRDPSYDDGPDPKLGYVEVYILQSLGRFEEASEAGRSYLEEKYASSFDMLRLILAWNALHAGKPEAAIRYNKTSDWTEPHRKLIAYLAQLAITGPEGAELQAKQWLEYGSPKTRKDWLIDERYVCVPLDDPKAFFRAEYDEAELKALASYAIALGPNNRKRSGSALEYRLPIAAVGNPYPVDYAYAEAIMKERHSAAADSEKLEAYLKAASLGTPRLPWGIAAQASFHLWKRSDRASAEELCRRGMALYPGIGRPSPSSSFRRPSATATMRRA